MALGRQNPTAALSRIALQYPAQLDSSEAIVQDFHSFRQALNVASADQRVLVLVHSDRTNEDALRESLKKVANDSRILGRFHFDFDRTSTWKEPIEGETGQHGLVIINPGEFGLTGRVISEIAIDSSSERIIEALTEANKFFARSTTKKVYSKHVNKGRAQAIHFQGNVPYGEDRDGDGEIDRRGPPPRRR